MSQRDICASSQRRAELPWDHPMLQVHGEPALRAEHRLLQSWYRERRLNARYAPSGPGRRADPVGSLLMKADVRADRALNFLGDPEILDFVDARVAVVAAEGGAAEPGRLFHNMLSSMPMAFSTAAVMRSAPDRSQIVSRQFGVDAKSIEYVTAEWAPADALRRIGRTAFDIAVKYDTPRGQHGLLGIEVKYTETPSDQLWITPDWIDFSDSCGWFRPGAGARLAHGPANQLWRNALLAAKQETQRRCDLAHLAILRLARDSKLQALVESVCDELAPDHTDRLIDVTWEEFIEQLQETSLASFAGQFHERYLDLSQLGFPDEALRLRRSIAATEKERRRRFDDAPEPEPSVQTTAEQLEWGRWIPTLWRSAGDPTSPLAVPVRPPTRLDEAVGWWEPAIHLMLYGLGWQSPAHGLQRWDCAGRPLEDPRLQLIEAIYGRHLETLLHHLWFGCGHYEDVSSRLGLESPERPEPPSCAPREVSRGVTRTPNPAEGGCDPLHLSAHCTGPLEQPDEENVELVIGDLGTTGPPRATLVCENAVGWYRALHEHGQVLPGNAARQGWRVDVIIRPVGHIGTFRQSRLSGRWFTGHHRWHELGVAIDG